jgi:uncharacterized protein (DUF983 family)
MPLLNRIFVIVLLLTIAAYCAYGVMATFEPPGWVKLRIVYAVTGILCLVGIARALFRKAQGA